MKEKLNFIETMLLIAFFVQLALFRFGGHFTPGNLYITILVIGPVALSAILAVVISEISDKRRKK